MRKLERVRLREGMTKGELARRLKTHKGVIRSWLTGGCDRTEGERGADKGVSESDRLNGYRTKARGQKIATPRRMYCSTRKTNIICVKLAAFLVRYTKSRCPAP
jgi:hypothetical protein